ncbi:MAG: AraC family transcriptional regulator [Flavobacteriaceae bacterium]|nr:AraC family transcriptional regulator [Flavobacteriaceae bacterium]
MKKTTKIFVKNMVCNRCIKVINDELIKSKIDFANIELGVITFNKIISKNDKLKLVSILEKEGFELVYNRETKIINQVKVLVIKNIYHNENNKMKQSYSNYLAENIKIDYSIMSKLFSDIEGKTIEHYIIEQKIERVKELLIYNELSISQISYELNYSSPQHLSRQFKQITGFTPSQFKSIRKRKKIDTI